MMTKRDCHLPLRWLGLAAALLLGLVSGCTGGCSREEPATLPPRLADPQYRAQLKEQERVRDQILGTLAERRRLFKEAEDAGAGEEELARLKADIDAALEEFEQNRQQSMAIVRERIWQDVNKSKQLEGKVK